MRDEVEADGYKNDACRREDWNMALARDQRRLSTLSSEDNVQRSLRETHKLGDSAA